LPTIVFLVGCAASNRRLAHPALSVAAQVNQMAGCYQLIDGDRYLPEGVTASPVLLLDSVPSSLDESPMMLSAHVLTADSVSRPATALSGWRIDPTDANLIRLWLSDGFEQSGLTLRRNADTLVGHVRRFADFPKVSLTHRARAVRVPCPAYIARQFPRDGAEQPNPSLR
jgi:hypothetical protein